MTRLEPSFRTLLCACSALFAPAGCARFEPRPLDLERSAGEFEARSLDTAELRAFIEANSITLPRWPPVQWDFEQLTLAALFLHPNLDVARAELASTRAAEITAGARPNPTVGITPEYNFNPMGGVTPWIATLKLDLPIETAGKRRLRLEGKARLSEAARLRLGSVAWGIRSDVRAALLGIGDANRRAELLERQLAAQERVHAALENKLVNGVVTANDLAPSRVALARNRSDLVKARAAGDVARARLAAALGLPLLSLPPASALRTDVPMDASVASGEARRRALNSRADLLAGLAGYAAAETALKLEIRKQYPDVHLGTGYEFDQSENKWALGLAVELPALNQNQGPIAEAEAKRSEAAARVLALQARIVGDVDRALAAWRGTQSSVAALDNILAAQKIRVASLKAQFEAGAIESLDLLTGEAELAAEELLRWEAEANAQRASGELEDAIQHPLTLDLSLNPRIARP